MALLGNHSVLNKSPLKFYGGSTVSVEAQLQSNFNKSGSMRNRLYIDKSASANKLYALPDGAYAGVSWFIPQRSGAMTAHNTASFGFTTDASGLLGLPTSGTASIVVSVGNASGQLISSGSGSASFIVTTNNPLLTASVNGTGTSSIIFNANALLGAIVSGAGSSASTFTVSATILPLNDASPLRDGSSTFTFTANASILPANDTSPLRNGTSTFTFSGALVPYASGYMIGSTNVVQAITPESISNSVWNAVLSDFTSTGTAGKALSSAGSGGVDIQALVNAIIAGTQTTPVNATVSDTTNIVHDVLTDPRTLTVSKFIALGN